MASQNDREMKIVILLLAAALLIPGVVAVAAASDRTDRMPVAVFDLRPAEARGCRTGKLLFVDQGRGTPPSSP